MESYSETESPVSISRSSPNPNLFMTKKKKKKTTPPQRRRDTAAEARGWAVKREEAAWPRKSKGGGVTLEGYVEAAAEGGDQGSETGAGGAVGRTKSLTDEDLEELKGCLDLGFGFSYEEIPELCNTLPALELCYSMSQRFLDEQQRSPEGEAPEPCAAASSSSSSSSSSPIANWRISSPGDDPDEVKARLKYWAQAVACTVRLCS